MVAKDSPLHDHRPTCWRPGRRTRRGSPVGGGSSPGGPDHLAPMLMAKAVGIAPQDVNYVAFDGGGELLASVLGGKVAFGVSGLGEYRDQIEAGELRLLAVTGPERVGRFRRTRRCARRAWTSSSPTGAASSRRRPGREGPGRADRRSSPRCTTPRSGATRWRATAGTTRSCRRGFGASWPARTSGWPACCGIGAVTNRDDDLDRSPRLAKEHSELGVCALLAVPGVLVLVRRAAHGHRLRAARSAVGPQAVPLVVGVAAAGGGRAARRRRAARRARRGRGRRGRRPRGARRLAHRAAARRGPPRDRRC